MPFIMIVSEDGWWRYFDTVSLIKTEAITFGLFSFGALYSNVLQGDPNQNLKFVLAITLKICISDPILVKPNCVWEVEVYSYFLADCLQFSAVCLQFFKKKLSPPKHILALPT